MENTLEKLGEKITKARNAKGWSQEKLSTEAEVSRRTIQNVETGITEAPGIDVVVKIGRALGLSTAYLIDDKPTKSERILALFTRLNNLNEEQLVHVEDALSQIEALDSSIFNLEEKETKAK